MPSGGRWQNWRAKPKPMSRGEFILGWLFGIGLLILLELAIH
jgi:hypothetical protein